MNKVILLLFVINSQFSLSQSVKGTIIDSATRVPIPYATIYDSASMRGTITNAEGQFIFDKMNHEILYLICTHISYQSKKLTPQGNDLTIVLTPKTTILREVAISDEAFKIARNTFNKFKAEGNTKFGKAFYRQITTNATTETPTPVEFFETFNDVSFSSSGLEKSNMYQSRYARVKNDPENPSIYFNNFSFLTFGSHIFSLKLGDVYKPLTPQGLENFSYSIRSIVESNGNKYATIDFEPSTTLDKPALVGNFTINMASGVLTNFTASLKNSLGLDSVKFEKSGQPIRYYRATNQIYEWVWNFREDTDGASLDRINVTNSFDVIIDGRMKKVKVSSILIVFEKNNTEKSNLKQPSIKLFDIAKIKKSRYDPKFWENNPIIKRTHFEDEIIASFEKLNSFGALKIK